MLNPGFPKISIGEGFYPDALLVAGSIDRLELSFHDFHEPLKQSLVEVIIPSIRENFNVEGRPSWQGLAESTINRRGSAHPILTVSGRLRAEATNEQNWLVTMEDVSLPGLVAAVPYAGYNQSGTSKMPAREFVNYQTQDIEEIGTIFSAWVERKIEESGFSK